MSGTPADQTSVAAPTSELTAFIWQPGRFDRWLVCPGALAMENAVRAIAAPDCLAFDKLSLERGRLALQILSDGATAALMHLRPGSVCMGCLAVDNCPRQRLDADDLV